MGVVERVERIITVPAAPAARAVARSPSAVARRWNAVGATRIGIATGWPEHRGRHLPAGDVHHHPVGEREAVVGAAVGAQRDLVVGAARVVVQGVRGELLAGDRFEIEDVDGFHGGGFYTGRKGPRT